MVEIECIYLVNHYQRKFLSIF